MNPQVVHVFILSMPVKGQKFRNQQKQEVIKPDIRNLFYKKLNLHCKISALIRIVIISESEFP